MLEVEGPVIPRFAHKVLAAAFGGDGDAAGVGMSKRIKTEAADSDSAVTATAGRDVSGSAVAVTADRDVPESQKAGGGKSKKKKVVTVRLSQDRIDRILAIPPRTRPFPVVNERVLARIMGPEQREKYMKMMAEAAAMVYKSREDVKREQDYLREELATLGYVEREIEVTDDEDEEAGDN